MKKGPFTSHPLFGVIAGIALAGVFIAANNALLPHFRGALGVWSPLASILFYAVFLGAAMKGLMLMQIARTVEVQPQSPVEFAGVREQSELRTAPAAPIPNVPTTSSNAKQAPPPALDFATLEIVTAELIALGFALACEGAMKTNRKKSIPMFTRMFEHPTGAFVELYQIFPVGRAPMPVSTAFFTFYSDDWVLADTNQKPSWVTWMIRRPRQLGKGHEQGTSIRAMWESHLARRAKVERELGVQPQLHSVADHLRFSCETLGWIRSAIVRRSILVAMLQNKFFRPKNREYWGEYPKFAKP